MRGARPREVTQGKEKKTYGIPTQPLVPLPNGTKALSMRLAWSVPEPSHRSGSNFVGFGKQSSSWWRTHEDMDTIDLWLLV